MECGEWVTPGLFTRHEGKITCNLQTKCATISQCAANTVPVRIVALLRVRPDAHVRLLLMTEGLGSIVRPRPLATPPGFVAYLDGSSDAGLEGWGSAIVTGGDGIDDTDATCVTEAHGPVVTNPDHSAYLGAQAFTNNTAELTALGETLRNLIAQADTPPSGKGIIQPDSKLAATCTMGTITPPLNRKLAAEVHRLYTILSRKRPMTWRHVRGHSD